MDEIFRIDTFMSTLEQMQLVDEDEVKDKHKKSDILMRTLVNKLEVLIDVKNEDEVVILVITLAKCWFWLCGCCIKDTTD